MEKAIIKEKKIQAILGIIFLIPPVLGTIAFVLQLFNADTDFSSMHNLTRAWTACYEHDSIYRGRVPRVSLGDLGGVGGGGGMSAAPIYIALMAFAGIWLIKGNLRYLLYTKKSDNTNENP